MMICAQCGAANFPKARFCKACGTALDASGATTRTSPAQAETTDSIPPEFPSSVPPAATLAMDIVQTSEPHHARISPATEPPDHPSAESTDDCPLVAELNFNRVLVAGSASTFQLRLTNRSPSPLEKISVAIEAPRTLDSPLAASFRRLAPGQTLTRLLEIEPARSGNCRLQFEVSFESAGEKTAYNAARPLRVNAPPDASNIVINIRDIQSNRDGQSNSALGAEYGDINISNLVDSRSIRTLNDLLELELPDRFEPLDLDLDYQLTMRGLGSIEKNLAAPVSIPPRLLGVCQPGECLELRPLRDGGATPILLVARQFLLIGRSSHEADLVSWFLPRSEVNDALTRRISKLHARLEVSAAGLMVAELEGASNGTAYNGIPVLPGQPALLERRGELALATAFLLDVQCFPSEFEGREPNISNIRLWPGPSGNPGPRHGAVRLLPVSGAPLPRSTIWLLSDAEFGTSHHNGIVIPGSTLAEIQGRFIHHRGCFWLENAAPNDAVSLDGQPLSAGQIAPLASGQTLHLGGLDYRLSVTRATR